MTDLNARISALEAELERVKGEARTCRNTAVTADEAREAAEAELERIKEERDEARRIERQTFKDAAEIQVKAEAAEARLAEAERVIEKIADEFNMPGHTAGFYARAFLNQERSDGK